MRLTLFFQTQNGKARDYFCERIVFPTYFVEQSIPFEVTFSWHGTAQFHVGNIDIRLSMPNIVGRKWKKNGTSETLISNHRTRLGPLSAYVAH
jgi:hypothetical protein